MSGLCVHACRLMPGLVLLYGLILAGLLPLEQALSAEGPAERFEQKVAPVLAAKCIACHRPDNLKGGLDLSTRELMLKGGEGGPALVAGAPEESPLLTRARAENGARPEMPEKGEPLTEAEVAELTAWIRDGATWTEGWVIKEASKADAGFWSFQPIAQPEPPVIDGPLQATWGVNPVDRFVLNGLSFRDLQPNPPARPGDFIRRATFDLHGLPPSPEEIAEFISACQQETGQPEQLGNQAVRQLIDRLLDSPRYGEQWGRHWLDVIRFGESRGYERNEIITNLWPFRDYVIRAFNEDHPFDQIIREHLAGDVLAPEQPEVEIGSAFLVAGPYDDVGNQDAMAAAQIRADQMDEMIRATSEAFLGLTLGCARCHDHKFDPLLTKDYYAWFASFSGTVHGPREVATAAARQERQQRLQPLQEERARVVAQREALEKTLAERATAKEAEVASTWVRPRASRYGTEERFAAVPARQVRLLVTGNDAPDGQPTPFKIDEFEVWTAGPESRNVALNSAGAQAFGAARDAKDFAGAYGAALTIDGKFGERWQASGTELRIELAAPETIERIYFSSDRTHALGEDHTLTTFVGDYRIEVSLDGQSWTPVASSDDRLPASPARKLARLRALVTTPEDTQSLMQLSAQIAQLDQQIAQIPPLPVWWVGTHRPAPGPFNVYVGGSPQRLGEATAPASLNVLNALPSAYSLPDNSSEGDRRLALANWMTAPDQPLTARVLANRVWKYHFGEGIVDTPSDFGYMGSRPTHPELLDWLARELMQGGWRLKGLHRLIMTSQAYCQSSDWREEASRVDADSRLLWRFPPRRLTGEEVRDALLQVTGQLKLDMGGPGFRLYEYQQDNVATYVPLDIVGPETFRRAVYHHNARAARVDVLTDFDCPDPAFAEPRRASTTTPMQALTLMNHSFALEMAQRLSERLEREAPDLDGRIQRAFLLTMGREPAPQEQEAGRKLITEFGWLPFCRALLNSNEFIQVP